MENELSNYDAYLSCQKCTYIIGSDANDNLSTSHFLKKGSLRQVRKEFGLITRILTHTACFKLIYQHEVTEQIKVSI